MSLTPGEGIRALRKLNDMSLIDLSEKTDIDVKRMSEIERSRANLTPELAEILASALGTFPGLLLSWNRDVSSKHS